MIAEPMPTPHATEPARRPDALPDVPHQPPAGRHGTTPGPAPACLRGGRPWARTLAAGAVALMAAFVTVQVGGCGFKTPLQLPKKAPPPKPAS